ncbi:ComF family protein [Chryseobacterium sp.]|uniref:ComF family protein n=1 Tax=Chryseobacterium sp. TaxID=1871047 RepID=UPI00388F6BE8
MFLDLFFPNRCLHCNRIIDAKLIVCGVCFEQIHFTHFDFSGENDLKKKCKLLFPVENAYALMKFEKENLSRKIIHELKYRSREIVGKILSEWTIERLNFGTDKPDLIVTVPLHPKKHKERGYNQLHLFANEIANYYRIPIDHDLVARNRYSKAQALRDKVQRLGKENTFSLTKDISGKHILLIDDVFTTGNTLATIAWELLFDESNKISILVMAVDE